jgi:hexosaminidase
MSNLILKFCLNYYKCWQVYFPCWNSSAEIVEWMAARGQGRMQDDFLQLWADYQSKVLQILDEELGNLKRPIILWSSRLTKPDRVGSFLSKDR